MVPIVEKTVCNPNHTWPIKISTIKSSSTFIIMTPAPLLYDSEKVTILAYSEQKTNFEEICTLVSHHPKTISRYLRNLNPVPCANKAWKQNTNWHRRSIYSPNCDTGNENITEIQKDLGLKNQPVALKKSYHILRSWSTEKIISIHIFFAGIRTHDWNGHVKCYSRTTYTGNVLC